MLVLSLAGLGALPRVAEALNGVTLPPLVSAPSSSAECRVVEVVDGDTVTLSCPGRQAERARLIGFDTPELFSPQCASERASAMQAKLHLATLIREADRLDVVNHGRDRYDRALVAMSVDGRPVASQMIDAGLARSYEGGQRKGWCGRHAEVAATAVGERGSAAKWVRAGG